MEIINVDIQLHVELVWIFSYSMFLTPVFTFINLNQSPCSYANTLTTVDVDTSGVLVGILDLDLNCGKQVFYTL